MARPVTISLVGYNPPKRRGILRTLGIALQPESVTAAWYAAGCPARFQPHVTRLDVLRWRVACWLRGC